MMEKDKYGVPKLHPDALCLPMGKLEIWPRHTDTSRFVNQSLNIRPLWW